MAKIKLRGVRIRGCSKPDCSTDSSTLNRHHKRHEAMWFGVWRRRRRGEPEFRAFRQRYAQYLEEDIVYVCVDHHAEIHVIYDKLIMEDIAIRNKPLARYTWREAKELMSTLEKACNSWLKEKTPGIDTHSYSAKAKKRREEKARKARQDQLKRRR